MQAERQALGLASFALGLLSAVLLFLPSSEPQPLYVSACVCLALMLFFGLTWAAVTMADLRRERPDEAA